MNPYANTEAPPRVAEFKGKVIRKESDVGIHDLMVQVFDVDPWTPLHKLFARASSDPLRTQPVGSVLTDQKGEFVLSYPPDDLQAGDRQTGRSASKKCRSRPVRRFPGRAPEETCNNVVDRVSRSTSFEIISAKSAHHRRSAKRVSVATQYGMTGSPS